MCMYVFIALSRGYNGSATGYQRSTPTSMQPLSPNRYVRIRYDYSFISFYQPDFDTIIELFCYSLLTLLLLTSPPHWYLVTNTDVYIYI